MKTSLFQLVDLCVRGGFFQRAAMAAGVPPAVEKPLHDTPAGSVLSLDNSKAGMALVDKAEVERVINEASRGSPFYANEMRKAALRQRRLEVATARSADYDAGRNGANRLVLGRKAEGIAREIEGSRSLGIFVHVDMDMFFAAVEELLRPELKSLPVGVGGEGMLSTSNYVARRHGVRAAMPGYIARKLCPQLVIVPSSYDEYRKHSELVRTVCRSIDPDFHSGGMDELTLNLTSYLEQHKQRFPIDDVALDDAYAAPSCHRLAAAARVAEELRAEITRVTDGLTASCGIAVTPTLAKMCSNLNKPNGQYVCRATTGPEIMAFLGPMGVRAIPGIGRATEHLLTGLGIQTLEQLYANRARLCHVVTGEKSFRNLLAAAMGVGHFWGFGTEQVDDNHAAQSADEIDGDNKGGKWNGVGRKSLSAERTFGGVASHSAFMEVAERVFDAAFRDLEEEGLRARQVTLKLKRKTFAVHQTTVTLGRPSSDRATLWRAFEGLVVAATSTATAHGGSPGSRGGAAVATFADFRLMGCRFADLSDDSVPLPPTITDAFAAAARGRPEKRARPPERLDVVVLTSDSDGETVPDAKDVQIVSRRTKTIIVDEE